ncbi:MFS transporter [Candidatus Dojkabacteria bacterium]|nr:MFS transporter [Candidatus Dojkabacteria bacterium]
MSGMFKKKEFIIIFFIKITEVLGFSLILPFLPIFAQDLGASPFTVGLIMSSFSLFQFITAPIMGKLSDIYGRRPFLIFSQLSTFLSFIILGFADSIWMLFLSRMIDGMLGSNMTIAQAYISDISTKEQRSKAFASTGIAFSVGFLIGPGVGGFLSKFGYHVPALVASVITLLTIVATYFFLPETVKKKSKEKVKFEIINIKKFTKFFSMNSTRVKLWEFTTFLFAHIIFVSSFALYAEKQLGFNVSQIGYTLTYIGAINILFRGLILNIILDKYSDWSLRVWGILSMFFGLFILSFAPNWIFLTVAVSFFSIGSGFVRPLTVSSITKSVKEDEYGSVIGVTNSLGSIVQIVAPLISGFLIDNFFPGSIGVVSSLIMLFALLLVIRGEKKQGSK